MFNLNNNYLVPLKMTNSEVEMYGINMFVYIYIFKIIVILLPKILKKNTYLFQQRYIYSYLL